MDDDRTEQGDELPGEPARASQGDASHSQPLSDWGVLHQTLALAWNHLWTVIALALLVGVICYVVTRLVSQALSEPLSVVAGHSEEFAYFLGGFLPALVLSPLRVGLAYAMLGLADGEKTVLKRVFTPFTSIRVLVSVVVAAGLVAAIVQTVEIAWLRFVPGELFFGEKGLFVKVFESQVILGWLYEGLPLAAGGLAVFPLYWAGLDVVARKASVVAALKHSVSLARSNLGLVGFYAAINTAALLTGSAVFSFFAMVALSVFYREMVWRERLAAERNAP